MPASHFVGCSSQTEKRQAKLCHYLLSRQLHAMWEGYRTVVYISSCGYIEIPQSMGFSSAAATVDCSLPKSSTTQPYSVCRSKQRKNKQGHNFLIYPPNGDKITSHLRKKLLSLQYNIEWRSEQFLKIRVEKTKQFSLIVTPIFSVTRKGKYYDDIVLT